jgi:glycosyltransferase involved in cell wall biosynthesis
MVKRLSTPNCSAGRDGHIPRGIVVHTTEGSFYSAVEWFSQSSSGVSAHYLVGLDGRVAQFVEEQDAAWHASRIHNPTTPLLTDANPSLYTIGIEFEDQGDPHGVQRSDEQYRAGAELIHSIARRWGLPIDRHHVVRHSEIYSLKSCPGNMDVERLIREARAVPTADPVVCLLPARNAAQDLSQYLESAARVCDAVIALDDGSTDETRELLEASALVEVILANPRRDTFRGWDDAANRSQLLAAAAELEPKWILSLDADERIDSDDALALRLFLDRDALPGCAFGFQHFRMWGDRAYDPNFKWIYRLFSYRPGQTFPDQRLHFNPVPTAIPRAAWMRTTIRVKHYGAMTEERRLARLAKYREADPEDEFSADLGGLSGRPEGELPLWQPRRPDIRVLLGPAGSGRGSDLMKAPVRSPDATQSGTPGPKLVCLLPARNCEADLPGYFESVARVADAVVALDDGSTDGSREALESHPLVKVVLTNPRRESYYGWDDGANRNRLLKAAGQLEPDWILSLDADERIGEGDAAALRDFIEREALPGFAYGFEIFRMVEGLTHYDDAETAGSRLRVYRLFTYEPGQRFPDARLHGVPIPESILRSRWIDTTLRIQHIAGITERRRRERFEKYLLADPENSYQQDYTHLLTPPKNVKRWEPRPSELGVLRKSMRERFDQAALEDLALDGPVLSAIVISRDDETRIERAVRSVVEQESEEPFEVIVVTSGTDGTADIVRQRFPSVRLVELPRPALPGAARNAGLRVARGDYVSFPGSHVELPRGSLDARIRAHELGYAMVTGKMLNGTRSWAGWASYFLDHAEALPGRPSGPRAGPSKSCSYLRDVLLELGGFREDTRVGEDTIVNRELSRRGYRTYYAEDVVLVHHSLCSNPWRLLRHHFTRGRGMGRILLDDYRDGGLVNRSVLRSYLLGYVFKRVSWTSARVKNWGGALNRTYRRALPLVFAGSVSAWIGIWYEILRPARGKAKILFGGS